MMDKVTTDNKLPVTKSAVSAATEVALPVLVLALAALVPVSGPLLATHLIQK